MLIPLIFCSEGVLTEPVLYLSLYLKTHRQSYYTLLQNVREEGDWESWLAFFFQGIIETSHQGIETAKAILSLIEQDQIRIRQLKRASGTALLVHHYLQSHVVVSIHQLSEALNISVPAASKSIAYLENLGIVREFTGRRRDRAFMYDQYLNLLQQGFD